MNKSYLKKFKRLYPVGSLVNYRSMPPHRNQVLVGVVIDIDYESGVVTLLVSGRLKKITIEYFRNHAATIQRPYEKT